MLVVRDNRLRVREAGKARQQCDGEQSLAQRARYAAPPMRAAYAQLTVTSWLCDRVVVDMTDSAVIALMSFSCAGVSVIV